MFLQMVQASQQKRKKYKCGILPACHKYTTPKWKNGTRLQGQKEEKQNNTLPV